MSFLEIHESKKILAQLSDLGVMDSALESARAFVSLCEQTRYEELSREIEL